MGLYAKEQNSLDRRAFIGGWDARTNMGDDEAALLGLWREKRGEVEQEDLSGNLIVQLGPYKRLFAVFDWKRFLEAHSWPSSVLVDELGDDTGDA